MKSLPGSLNGHNISNKGFGYFGELKVRENWEAEIGVWFGGARGGGRGR